MRNITLLVIIFLSGCKTDIGDKINKDIGKTEVNKKTVELFSNSAGFSDLFTLDDVIHLATDAKCLIGEIESVIYIPEESKIIVFDRYASKSIFLFDTNGRYLNSIGKKGKGPGEFIDPIQIAYENGILAVYADHSKILLYKLDGTLINEKIISDENIYRDIQKTILFNNDFYGYAWGTGFNVGDPTEECRVFRFRNCEYLDESYAGKPESSFYFEFGDMVLFYDTIIFSSSFNGKLYQINLAQDDVKLFAELGQMADVNNINSQTDPMIYIQNNMKNIDAILALSGIQSFVFVERIQGYSVLDPEGRVIAKNIKNDYELPLGFEGYSMRKGKEFYKDGIIVASLAKENISGYKVPNPSLLFYKLKETGLTEN